MIPDAELTAFARASTLQEASFALRGIVAALAPYVSELRLGPSEAEETAERAAGIAASFLAREARVERDADLRSVARGSTDWRERSDAALRADYDPGVVGSLAGIDALPRLQARPARWLDGAIAAESLCAAVIEIPALPRLRALREASALAGMGDASAVDRAESELALLRPIFAAIARACGRALQDAHAAAWVATLALAGEARSAAAAGDPAGFGAAAVFTLPSGSRRTLVRPAAVHGESRPAWRVVRAVRELNTVRARLRGAETVRESALRTFGAAGIAASYGFTQGWHRPKTATRHAASKRPRFEDPHRVWLDGQAHLDLPEGWLERLAPLALEAAIDRLDAWAADRRLSVQDRRRAEYLADALRASSLGWNTERVSFAAHLSAIERHTPAGALDEGMRVHWSVPKGRYPVVCAASGKSSRAVRCRALADDEGRLVGYAAYDALSREFSGDAAFAAYDLEGKLFGRMEPRGRSGGTIFRAAPRHGWFTAPQAIPLPAPLATF